MPSAGFDPEFWAVPMEQLLGAHAAWAHPTSELLSGEIREVEYKQTTRWNVRKERKDQAMEIAVVEAVVGMLDAHGGTLPIGDPTTVTPSAITTAPPRPDSSTPTASPTGSTLRSTTVAIARAQVVSPSRMGQIDVHNLGRFDVQTSLRSARVKKPQG